jgi:hypothetical protein
METKKQYKPQKDRLLKQLPRTEQRQQLFIRLQIESELLPILNDIVLYG